VHDLLQVATSMGRVCCWLISVGAPAIDSSSWWLDFGRQALERCDTVGLRN